jgi:hypothetical protein
VIDYVSVQAGEFRILIKPIKAVNPGLHNSALVQQHAAG